MEGNGTLKSGHWNNIMREFGKLSREEKGELLLAHHEGREIEFLGMDRTWKSAANDGGPGWCRGVAYRVKPITLEVPNCNFRVEVTFTSSGNPVSKIVHNK